jgi:hypothetical protein
MAAFEITIQKSMIYLQLEDSESRVSEAVTRCLVSLLLEARQQLNEVSTAEDNWINPGEVSGFNVLQVFSLLELKGQVSFSNFL